MRIIGYLEDQRFKITAFKSGNKFALKFETDLLEQTYKVRESNAIANLEDLNKLVDEQFKTFINDQFVQMRKELNESFIRLNPMEEEDEFEEIV